MQWRRTCTQEVAPPAPMPSSLIMASVMRLSPLPPPPPPPLVSVVTPAAAPPPSYLQKDREELRLPSLPSPAGLELLMLLLV